MRVRLLLFAWLAERAGAREIELELAPGAKVRNALDAASERLSAPLDPADFAVAVNERFSDLERPVREGDVLALIPPVSGG